jgi:hypothetical protein
MMLLNQLIAQYKCICNFLQIKEKYIIHVILVMEYI